jgi:hypothetical protein
MVAFVLPFIVRLFFKISSNPLSVNNNRLINSLWDIFLSSMYSIAILCVSNHKSACLLEAQFFRQYILRLIVIPLVLWLKKALQRVPYN